MYRLAKITGLFIFLLMVLACGPSYSYTLVTGEVGGQTWLRSLSPYRLSGEVTVSNASLLTIEAGVTVECERNSRLHVFGTLFAPGTPEGIITFISTRGASSAAGDWAGIFLDGIVTSLFKNCNIQYAITAFSIYYPVKYVAPFYSYPLITNCYIANSTYGFYIQDFCMPSILNCVIRKCYYGVYAFTNGAAPPRTIIKYNLISENQYGIYLFAPGGGGAYPNIFGNTISTNEIWAVFGTSSSPRVNFNNFFGNTGGGIWSNVGIDATKNWWGKPGGPGASPEVTRHVLCTDYLGYPVKAGHPTSITQVSLMADRNYSSPLTGSLGIPDIMYIQVTGTDSDPNNYNWTTVLITNEYSGVASEKQITVDLMETGKNTGVYRGTAWTAGVAEGDITSYHDDSKGFIRALPNDRFKMGCVDGGNILTFYPSIVTTWKKVNNPIRLVGGGYYLPNNRTAFDDPERTILTVEAGVSIEAFWGNYIYPNVASGDASNRIVFTTGDPSPEVGLGWSGIWLLGNNIFRFCDVKYAVTGVYMHYQSDVIDYNNIMYCQDGLTLGYYNPRVFKNNIKWNSLHGVSAASGSVLARYNNIVGNGLGWNNQSFLTPGYQDDASENYWGASDGPTRETSGSGNGVSTRVAYKPWLPVEVDFGPAPALTAFGLFLDKDCTIPAANVGVLDNFYISAESNNPGVDGKIHIARASVKRTGAGNYEIICDLLETGPNTGIYMATVRVTQVENNNYKKHIMALSGDTLTVSLPDNGLVPEQTLNVTRTARWRKENNPNRILGGDTTLLVNEGYRLMIDPGVVVQSSTRVYPMFYALVINGSLEALGSPESRITFTATVPDPKPGDWGWLYFTPASAAPTASILRNCDILNCQGIYLSNFSASIEGCRIGSSETGIWLAGTTYPSRSVIRDNEIYNSTGFGMQCLSSGVPFVERNYIHDNPCGITVSNSGPLIRTNTIESNNVSGAAGLGGIVFSAAGNATPEVTDNGIKNNRRNIVVTGAWNKNMPVIQYNNIYNDPGNGEVGVEKYPAVSPTVDATYNYWGGPNGPKHPVTNPTGNPNSTVTNFVSYETYLTAEANRGGPVATQESPPDDGATNNPRVYVSVKVIAPYGLDLVHNPPVLSVNGISHTYPDGGRLSYESSSSRLTYVTGTPYPVGTQEISLLSASNVIGIELKNKPFVWDFIVDSVSPEIGAIYPSSTIEGSGTLIVTVEVHDDLSGINYAASPTVELDYPGGKKRVTQATYGGEEWTGTVEVLSSTGNGWASIEVSRVLDRAGNVASSTIEPLALFIDTVSPEVAVTEPVAGQYSWGRMLHISWEAHDPSPTLGLPPLPVNIYYCTGEGMLENMITAEVENTGSFEWTLPNVISTQCFVIVEAVDLAGNAGRARSPGYFSIVPINPYVVSTRPPNGATGVSVDRTITYIQVTFDTTMDADSVNSISISPEAPGYPLLLSNRLLYMFSNDLLNDVSYEVSISDEAKDLEGDPILNAPYTFGFRTIPLDITPPVLGPVELNGRLYSPVPPNNIMARSPVIRAMITDEAGGSGVDPTSIKISIDGQVFYPSGYLYDELTGWLTYGVSTEFSVGTYVITIEARDKVGNLGTWEAGVVVVPGPTIDRVRFDGRLYVKGDIISSKPSIEARILDEGGSSETIDPSSIRVKAGPNVLTAPSSAYDFSTAMMDYDVRREPTAIGPGTYTITIEAKDIYGNLGRWEGYDLRVMAGRVTVVGNTLAYPSPFSPLKGQTLRIAYTLSVAASVTVYVYDISGQIVMTKKFGANAPGGLAGYNDFTWDGRSDFGRYISNGIYIYKIVSGKRAIGAGKIVVLD